MLVFALIATSITTFFKVNMAVKVSTLHANGVIQKTTKTIKELLGTLFSYYNDNPTYFYGKPGETLIKRIMKLYNEMSRAINDMMRDWTSERARYVKYLENGGNIDAVGREKINIHGLRDGLRKLTLRKEREVDFQSYYDNAVFELTAIAGMSNQVNVVYSTRSIFNGGDIRYFETETRQIIKNIIQHARHLKNKYLAFFRTEHAKEVRRNNNRNDARIKLDRYANDFSEIPQGSTWYEQEDEQNIATVATRNYHNPFACSAVRSSMGSSLRTAGARYAHKYEGVHIHDALDSINTAANGSTGSDESSVNTQVFDSFDDIDTTPANLGARTNPPDNDNLGQFDNGNGPRAQQQQRVDEWDNQQTDGSGADDLFNNELDEALDGVSDSEIDLDGDVLFEEDHQQQDAAPEVQRSNIPRRQVAPEVQRTNVPQQRPQQRQTAPQAAPQPRRPQAAPQPQQGTSDDEVEYDDTGDINAHLENAKLNLKNITNRIDEFDKGSPAQPQQQSPGFVGRFFGRRN